MMTGKIEEGVYPRILIPAVTSAGNIVKKMLVIPVLMARHDTLQQRWPF
jgi:hypothetical protein